jgi:transposase-like protein
MMAEHGVIVSYESVREWSLKFGGMYTKRIRSRRGRLGDRWHLDEVFLVSTASCVPPNTPTAAKRTFRR